MHVHAYASMYMQIWEYATSETFTLHEPGHGVLKAPSWDPLGAILGLSRGHLGFVLGPKGKFTRQ